VGNYCQSVRSEQISREVNNIAVQFQLFIITSNHINNAPMHRWTIGILQQWYSCN